MRCGIAGVVGTDRCDDLPVRCRPGATISSVVFNDAILRAGRAVARSRGLLGAIEERLAWAGLPVEDNDFALVTHYENMSATKPSQHYYRDILTRIDCSPEECLMVGDNWEWDILPTTAMGMRAFWMAEGREVPEPLLPGLAGHGELSDVLELISQNS